MNAAARRTPTEGAPVLSPAEMDRLGVPDAGPLDEFTRARLTAIARGYFGDLDTLPHHIALLDARGAWYAEQVITEWPEKLPDSFFGVVAHVIATQLPDPAPQPDLDTWLAAGCPDDPVLAARWEQVRGLRSLDGTPRPIFTRPHGDLEPTVRFLDHAIETWPEEHWANFLLAYVKVPFSMARRGFVLPPIGS